MAAARSGQATADYVRDLVQQQLLRSELKALKDRTYPRSVDELKPTEGDYVIKKQTYSGFVNTDLDVVLRRLGTRYLFFTGIETPTCVEATARDAYFREYWPVLVSDCCGAIMPETHEAALFAIKRRYGWVTNSEALMGALALHEGEGGQAG